MRRLRHQRRCRGSAGEGRCRRRRLDGGVRFKTVEAARGLADAAGRHHPQNRRRGRRAHGRGRHRHRRRQFLLPRRGRPGCRVGEEGYRLRRCRHQRRRLGPRPGLLSDDRRAGPGGEATRPDLCHARPRRRCGRQAGQGRRHRALRLPPLRTERRRPFRQDGSQRHRIRRHGRLCRGHEHPESGQRRHGEAHCRRRDQPAADAAILPVRHRPAGGRRGLAARLGDRLLAARPDGARAEG